MGLTIAYSAGTGTRLKRENFLTSRAKNASPGTGHWAANQHDHRQDLDKSACYLPAEFAGGAVEYCNPNTKIVQIS